MSWDPFAVLDLPRTFDLDRTRIERAYLERASALHPDVPGMPPADDDDPGSAAAELNRARQDLSDPETRANVLLALLGGPSKEQDRSLPDGFLMEMMEVREQMEAAQTARDTAALEKWGAWAEDQRRGHVAAVGDLFRQAESQGPAPAPSLLKAIRTRLNAWRYIERMLEQQSSYP